jgi:hypothetical protein
VADHRIDAVPHETRLRRRHGQWGEVPAERHRSGKRDARSYDHQRHAHNPHPNGKAAAVTAHRQQHDRREQYALPDDPNTSALKKAIHAGQRLRWMFWIIPQSRFLGFRASQKYSRLSHREWQALLALPSPCEFAPTPLTAAMSGAAKALTAMAG